MSLEEYQKKRDLERSPEPKGENKKDSEKNATKIFVIQEHWASHHHWDLRLEMGGVLRSWAVPKEPPTVEGVKRLAIQVEDHPLEYASFEGTIPEGMYGAGTVKIYDIGELVIEEETDNKILFQLKGKKMTGKYVLMHVPNMGENSWLFFKRMQF